MASQRARCSDARTSIGFALFDADAGEQRLSDEVTLQRDHERGVKGQSARVFAVNEK